jgi:hypothetical protein
MMGIGGGANEKDLCCRRDHSAVLLQISNVLDTFAQKRERRLDSYYSVRDNGGDMIWAEAVAASAQVIR